MSDEHPLRDEQNGRAATLAALHRGPRILVLPNAWDVASARIFEAQGFAALGTTSAGLAWALGSADGESLGRTDMIEATRRICAGVSLPVTADIESGYGDDADAVGETVRRVIAAGAVGINLEDGTGDPDRPLRDIAGQVDCIRAARKAAVAAGIALVINARTDVYWSGVGAAGERLALTVSRTNAFREAGADCVFVPGVGDADVIRTLVQQIDGPLNVLAGPGVPAVSALEELGVARVSVGSGPVRAALGLTRRLARELRTTGCYDGFTDAAMPYADINDLMARRKSP
ncbi:isocitrate lyase/PEP mutase family protein [Salinisphaera aquimarina]|uniref:Isocitrate lyase/phosphoenolpyruvate mutase family protein n=1 Tax=Salinisphaera aquimarina TaxID=2094031 RepID=A0ABV7EML8_9GAMM